MSSRRLKLGYFALEGMNSFATIYYFNYFYFFMQQRFGFDNKANLALAALGGGVYAVCSWGAGKVARRVGYFNALKLGLLTMMTSLAVGLALNSAVGITMVMLLTTVGMCFIWPTIEALVTEGEPASEVPKMVGIYNLTWAGTAALANFSGGAMLQHLGLRSLFYVPMAIQVVQLSLTFWLEGQARRVQQRSADLEPAPGEAETRALAVAGAGDRAAELRRGARPSAGAASRESTEVSESLDTGVLAAVAAPEDGRASELASSGARHGKTFLNMAWLANPFAYIAINTLIATIPGVASRLHLSTTLAGFCCSLWYFARVGAFFGLYCWNGWHYRFRWLLLSYVTLVVTFAAILLTPSLLVLLLAQVAFGIAAGLIYYSSLFYSMDQSDTKSEHGGIHEAAIGLGNLAGPAVGALALQFVPQQANSGALAVTVLLVGGLGGLLTLWRKGCRSP
jgi:predicted MFS family arabinose efflux permease